MTDTWLERATVNWTTAPVDLPGVEPTDGPTELIPGQLWHGGCPVDFDWVTATGICVVVDLADADALAPAEHLSDLIYLKCPLVDHDTVPDPALTLRLADLVAGLIADGRTALVHCTFGRNRSGLMTTLVVRRLLGLGGAEALQYVQQRRRGTVNNAAFAAWLKSLPPPA